MSGTPLIRSRETCSQPRARLGACERDFLLVWRSSFNLRPRALKGIGRHGYVRLSTIIRVVGLCPASGSAPTSFVLPFRRSHHKALLNPPMLASFACAMELRVLRHRESGERLNEFTSMPTLPLVPHRSGGRVVHSGGTAGGAVAWRGKSRLDLYLGHFRETNTSPHRSCVAAGCCERHTFSLCRG